MMDAPAELSANPCQAVLERAAYQRGLTLGVKAGRSGLTDRAPLRGSRFWRQGYLDGQRAGLVLLKYETIEEGSG